MHLSIPILLTAIYQATTLGINCRGSRPLCDWVHWSGMGTIMQLGMPYVLAAKTPIPPSTYQATTRENIYYLVVCLTSNGQGGICAFLQSPTNVIFGKMGRCIELLFIKVIHHRFLYKHRFGYNIMYQHKG